MDSSLGRWLADLEDVVDAADIREPFALLGISQGAASCVQYAVKHPERVSHLVLYGAYARGVARRGDSGHGARLQRHRQSRRGLMGQGQPGVPAGVHVALRARRARTSSCGGSMTSA